MKTYTVIKVNQVTKEETIIATGLVSNEVSGLVGIPINRIPGCIKDNSAYLRQYKFVVDGEVDHHVATMEIIDKWNEMMKAAELLRNGGRIVTKKVKGKLVKYVEAAR